MIDPGKVYNLVNNFIKNILFKVLIIILAFILFPETAFTKPLWIEKVPEGYKYSYHVGIGESSKSVSAAKKFAISTALSSAVQSSHITIVSDLTSSKESTVSAEGETNFISRITEDVNIKGHSTDIKGLSEVESFTETVNKDGKVIYRVYVLIKVPKQNPTEKPGVFNYVFKSAIAPGWAQFEKGYDTKAWVIIIGEAVLVPTAIAAYILHNDFSEKSKIKDVDYRDHYNTLTRKAYYALLGSAAAAGSLYIYNIVDAAISKDKLHMAIVPDKEGLVYLVEIDF